MSVDTNRVWLLDLDNTLHDAMTTTFPLIKVAMGRFIERELSLDEKQAGELRDRYGRLYGATLLGLVRHHGIDASDFLRDAHRLDELATLVRPDARLIGALRRLPGRRILLTNAPLDYARRVTTILGIKALLDQVVSIESMQFAGRLQPKPSRPMFRRLLASLQVPAHRCVLVEDSISNLRAARAVGIRGVLITRFAHRLTSSRQPARALSARRVTYQLRCFSSLHRQASRYT